MVNRLILSEACEYVTAFPDKDSKLHVLVDS